LAASFEQLGFDSLSFMEFCISIHCDTGVELTVGEVSSLGTPAAVVDYLRQRG
jgi:acyl carrier protein